MRMGRMLTQAVSSTGPCEHLVGDVRVSAGKLWRGAASLGLAQALQPARLPLPVAERLAQESVQDTL